MWRDRTTGNVIPYLEGARLARPDTSMPAVLTDALLFEHGFDPIEKTSPAFNPITQVYAEAAPELVDGKWVQQWSYERRYATQAEEDAAVAAEAASVAAGIRSAAKANRATAVSEIKVTTQAGNTFDGDETSQGRMARAIIALSTGIAPSVNWVLADNSVIQATPQELTEAMVLAGQAQAALWVI